MESGFFDHLNRLSQFMPELLPLFLAKALDHLVLGFSPIGGRFSDYPVPLEGQGNPVLALIFPGNIHQ